MADGDQQRLGNAREALERHREKLMRTYGAVGAGVGAGARVGYAIVLYLAEPRPVPDDASVDGVPLRFEVTGRPRAQP
jgi:hypothetical protein